MTDQMSIQIENSTTLPINDTDDNIDIMSSTELKMNASDVGEISNTEICDSSLVQITHGSLNPTTVSLLRCKKQIVIPYYKLLGIIAWRPFGGMSRTQYALIMKLINIVYPVLIVSLLLFSYVTSAVACRGETSRGLSLNMTHEIKLNTPIPAKNITISPMRHNQVHSSDGIKSSSHEDDPWEPAYNECKHIFGTFILPSMLHLSAYLIGFYLYRVRQHEGLYVLMEKVFLQSSKQKRLYVTLWCFVILGMVWLILDMGVFVLFFFAFGPETVTGFRHNKVLLVATATLMTIGQLVLDLVNVVIILSYAAQCQLVIHYIDSITRRIEEKSTHLQSIMKDILDVKNTLGRMNSLLSHMVSLCIFTLLESVVLGLIYLLINEGQQSLEVTLYRASYVFISFLALFFPILQAARVTSLASQFKQISLDVRVFGHQTSSQLELDSFLVFVQSADLKAKLFLAPVRGSLLSGITLLIVFTLLFLMHTGQIASGTKLF
ncbi:uncharacterized protein LOC114524431 [Dendronephthya gigantea]|uniref:uncharacterized protein LOC114524431 n=1 Tax=Dendronephthya gigantea TaxID=151771 RepID=UPI001068F7C9|nr:uncharacterized protein LOC114524431 [Dendronephthya gigantea]